MHRSGLRQKRARLASSLQLVIVGMQRPANSSLLNFLLIPGDLNDFNPNQTRALKSPLRSLVHQFRPYQNCETFVRFGTLI